MLPLPHFTPLLLSATQRRTAHVSTLRQGVVDFLEKYPDLPEDPYFLDSLLDHPRDRIVDKALTQLERLCGEGRLKDGKLPKSLDQRLKSVEMTSMDSELQARAKALREKIR